MHLAPGDFGAFLGVVSLVAASEQTGEVSYSGFWSLESGTSSWGRGAACHELYPLVYASIQIHTSKFEVRAGICTQFLSYLVSSLVLEGTGQENPECHRIPFVWL